MPANLRRGLALRVDRKSDARDHGVAANIEGDTSVDQRVGGGEHLGVAVNIERAVAAVAHGTEANVLTKTCDQHLAVRLHRNR